MAKLGEVWLAPFAYTEKPWKRKLRPVVVIDVKEDSCLCTTAMVTTKPSQNLAEEMEIVFWQNAGLDAPSFVRFTRKQVFLFDDSRRRLGMLDGRDQLNLWRAVENYQNKKRQR